MAGGAKKIFARIIKFLFRTTIIPEEKSIFIYTKEGKDIAWISNTLGISSKTVWTHRRRAMDKLGVKRLHRFINIPRSLLVKIFNYNVRSRVLVL